MPTASYERIPLEAEDHELSPNGHYPPTVVKPATYYEEGEFDSPSSDDEEEELFMEKGKHGVPNERGGTAGDGLNEDVELVIGGHKVFGNTSMSVHSDSICTNSRDTKDRRLCVG